MFKAKKKTKKTLPLTCSMFWIFYTLYIGSIPFEINKTTTMWIRRQNFVLSSSDAKTASFPEESIGFRLARESLQPRGETPWSLFRFLWISTPLSQAQGLGRLGSGSTFMVSVKLMAKHPLIWAPTSVDRCILSLHQIPCHNSINFLCNISSVRWLGVHSYELNL